MFWQKRFRMIRRFVAQATAIACVCLLIGACGVQKTEPVRVNLADVVLAVGLNPSAQKFTEAKSAMVALVHKDGTAEYIDTTTSTPQNMAWNRAGLFFDDKEHNFFIATTLGQGYVSDRANPNVPGWQMVPVGDGAMMAMYQAPYSDVERSTMMQTQWFTPQPRQVVTKPAALPDVVAQCSSGIFAVARDEGYHVLYSASEADGMLQADAQPVNKRFIAARASGAVPCVGDELTIFGGSSNGTKGNSSGSQVLTLLKWNVKTHDFQQQTVTSTDGKPQSYDGEASFAYGTTLTADNGEMIVMTEDGKVEFIDMRTAEITKSAESPQVFDAGAASYSIVGSDDYAYLIFTPNGDTKDTAKVFVYRKSDWKLIYTITAQGALNDLLSNRKELHPTVFAANPTMSWD